jgi:hypothetical protein
MSERIMLDCKLRIARSEVRRSFRQFVIAFAVIAASAIPSFAGETTTPTYSQALDALYNLDFSNAEHAFSSLVGEDPPNPDYWNGLASTPSPTTWSRPTRLPPIRAGISSGT